MDIKTYEFCIIVSGPNIYNYYSDFYHLEQNIMSKSGHSSLFFTKLQVDSHGFDGVHFFRSQITNFNPSHY